MLTHARLRTDFRIRRELVALPRLGVARKPLWPVHGCHADKLQTGGGRVRTTWHVEATPPTPVGLLSYSGPRISIRGAAQRHRQTLCRAQI